MAVDADLDRGGVALVAERHRVWRAVAAVDQPCVSDKWHTISRVQWCVSVRVRRVRLSL